MNVTAFMADLAKQGVKVWADGEQLRYRAPKGVVTASLLSKLGEYKAELLTVMSDSQEHGLTVLLPVATGQTREQATGEAQGAVPTVMVVPAPAQMYLPFPITDVQQVYWIGRSTSLELGNVGSHCYIEVEAVELDLERALLALRRLIKRHPMLRAIMLPDGQQQVIEDVPPFCVSSIDLLGLNQQEQDEQLKRIRYEMDHQVFQVERWPALEIRISHLHERRVRIHVSIEALFADAWSIRILVREFTHLYHEPEASFPPLELLFRDYVLTETQLQASELYQRSQDYWTERIHNLPPAPDLPLVIDPALLPRPRFVPRQARLDAAKWQQLKARAARAGLTPSGILLAAFAEVLTTWSKTPRFCINLTTFHRLPLHEQVNEIVGDFTSLLLLAVDNSLPAPFEKRAKRLQEQLWRDFDHRYYSGVRVLRDLARRPGNTTQAIMPVVFTSVLGQQTATTDPAPWQETIYYVTQTPQVWLDHQVLEEDGNLVFYWHAVEALFPPGLLDAMFEAYTGFLQKLAADDEIWQAHSSGLVPSSQLAQRACINATETPVSERLLQHFFLEQFAKRPHQLAVISARRTLPYQEVLRRAMFLGHQLRQLGARPNHLVGIVMEKGWEQVVGVMGIVLSGAAYLPIDPKLPAQRLIWMLEHGEVEVVVTQSWVEKRVYWPERLIRLCVDEQDVTEIDVLPLDVKQKPEDLAYVIYTSGSTGLPKGVGIDHRGAVNTILDINERFAVTSEDRVLALSALHFDLSVYDIFGLLAAGGTIVMPTEDAWRNPAVWLDLLLQERVTLWNTVPALLEMLVEYAEADSLAMKDSCLRLALLSGDWIPVSLPDRLRKLTNNEATRQARRNTAPLEIISLGGATEASIWSIFYPIPSVEPPYRQWSCATVPYGRPLRNQCFFVLNEKLESCPVWVAGHLYIGGIGLARGYWRDEEKTQASFLLHPQTGERLYKTGDLGRYLPDGTIEFLGREDFQVKVAGHRIELGEIEATLLDHPLVRQAVVTAIGKPFENKHLIAYIVPTSGLALPHEGEHTDNHGVDWETLVSNCQTYRQILSEPMVDDVFLDVWRTLEQISLRIVCKALNDFGVFGTPYEHYSVEELIQHCAIHPRYSKWLQRNLGLLVQNGRDISINLQEQKGVFRCEEPLPVIAVDELWNTYQKAASALTDPDLLDLGWDGTIPVLPFRRIEDLKAVLTEEFHSAQIYVSTEMRGIYRQLHASNILIQTFVEEVVRLAPQGKKIRILEIGAGFGIATVSILPKLPLERTEYVYTDISAYFLQEAQEKFVQYPFVSYGLLDIEKDPHAQGYEWHDFDIVIAANVLHATANITESLMHIRSLLKSHGILLLQEGTRFHPLLDLTMGLHQGIDRFEDTDLRQSHPFLSRDMWREVLRKQGFVSSAIFNKPDTLTDFLGIDVLLAQGPASTSSLRLTELYEHLRSKLPEYMIPSRIVSLETLPLSSNGKVDRHALPHPLIQSHKHAISSVAARTPTEQALIHLWSEILKRSNIGIDENFLELGGDSLLATKLLTRVRANFSIEVPLQVMFQNPTIAVLAKTIEQAQVNQQMKQQSFEGTIATGLALSLDKEKGVL